ncbi:MAG: patatin-like phospholipase family protein [Chitinophagales bacterium]
MIKNLVLKGGGVKGIAYVGALHELEKVGMLGGIERVAGTSVGSLVAGMVCAGYNADEIEKLMFNMKFEKFKSGFNPFRLFTHYGLYSGNYILRFIHDFMNASPMKLQPGATFYQMQKAGCKNLYVFSCNLHKHIVEEFSVDTTPHAVVADAIRASMSIPIFFKAWQFPNGIPNKDIYVDGGIVYNYPLTFFDGSRFNTYEHENLDSLGLYLNARINNKEAKLGFSTPIFFMKQLLESLLDTQNFIMHEDKEEMRRSILIDDLGFPATDFNITDSNKRKLVESGRQAVKTYLEKKKQQQEVSI